jgi:hypothetical protein
VVILSALFLYASFVFGLTDPDTPAHYATLLVRRLSFVLISQILCFFTASAPGGQSIKFSNCGLPGVSVHCKQASRS